MKTVWKFHLPPAGVAELELPRGASALTVQLQDGGPKLWALVDPDAPRVKRHFRIIGTGHVLESDAWLYVGTFQLHQGALVYHVFDMGEA